MKLYVLDKHKVSLMNNGKVISYQPFIMVNDEDSSLFEKAGYTLADTIFDVTELREISSKIESISKGIEDKLQLNYSELESLKTDIKSFCDYGDKLKNNLLQIESIKEYAEDFHQNIEDNKIEIAERFKELENRLSIKESDFNKEYDLKTADLNNLLSLIEKGEIEISERLKAQYDLMTRKMVDFYSVFKDEAEKFLEEMRVLTDLSRKWAVNPVNVPVEQGKYSARHYALKMNGEK